jgi:hypothetical protein
MRTAMVGEPHVEDCLTRRCVEVPVHDKVDHRHWFVFGESSPRECLVCGAKEVDVRTSA